jgi:PBP superfamily domain
MRNLKIASAVALALGGVSAAQAASPTLANCRAPAATLYVAGSSAAQNSFANALNTDLFGGGEVTYSASNGNFKAYCGFSTNSAVAPVGSTVVVHYRAEGGSVVGALPIVSGQAIKFLDLTNGAVSGTTVPTTGTSAANGTTDSWGGALTSHTVEVGVTDVEPGALIGKNYPTAYSAAVFGSATPAQLGGLTKTALFDQVFGLFVNTSGLNASGASGQPVDLTRETAANILTGKYTDWKNVPTASGGSVSTVSAPITVVNREAGSGTRTGASIYFLGYNCGQVTVSIPETGAADGFQTADVLATAGSTPGAITYASIDNAGKPNLSTVSLSGVAPTNLAATSGAYDYWFEAQLIKGNIVSSGGLPIYTFLSTELSTVNTAPHLVDILAIPNAGSPKNHATVPVTANTAQPGAAIYVNPFTRGGLSCNVPTSTN